MDIRSYLAWIASDHEKIAVKKMLVDIAGDLVAGIVLSQIEYWHLPSKTGKSRLRVQRDGFKWLVKRASDWQSECRISAKQARRALHILVDRGLIITMVGKYRSAPTTFIRINWDSYLAAVDREITQRSISILPFGTNPIGLEGQMELDESANSITDTTTDTTVNEEENATRPLTAWQEKVKAMADPIAVITGDNMEVEQTKRRIGQIAAQLIKAGYTPADIATFQDEWAREDWRGRQGKKPTREQVLSELPRLLAAREAKTTIDTTDERNEAEMRNRGLLD